MRRADRLFQIVQLLRGGRLTRAADLASELEVSSRTIYRDIADLIGSGVPIEGEAGVGYVMRAGYDIPPLMFTRDEVMALIAGISMIERMGGAAMAKSARDAHGKIRAVLPEALSAAADRVEVHAGPTLTPSDRDRHFIDQIEAAVGTRRRLHLTYTDGDGCQTTRTIRPLGLWLWQTGWCVVGWCELRSDFRMFRVDRIEGFTTGEVYREEREKSLSAFYARMHAEACET
ncbi:Predicted DNA-binding transcriptional regulator YafY, contains an HTH and WYL domains [Aliiroseovarius crassostreae]|uniref:DNA-binding transcriptional regulator n=1 Tax=Aliiroseovarius crassostreae TaxID=154981 RepID=A0A0P7IK41_9RHOB|nr:YafY family protein [Aliiroseovarius crassostreae]KPN64393.1 DNA-binding transcriptional regulator [Aliiroseovarius crassostreae]SFU33945.1 Predicted DNA-binding transcriptional regulator YafY, contains an HTH and WYL domains [Aliiroseovarius crassostreae]